MDEIESFSVAGLVAPHPLAAAAGRDVLVEGGSVVEAAIAAAAVSAVVVPHRNGLGGDALWLVREAGPRGRVRVLDARGVAGEAVTPSRYRRHDAVPLHGPDAVLTVPGAVAAWAAAHDLSTALGGRLPLSRLLAPAVTAASDGVDLPGEAAKALTAAAPSLSTLPGFARTFLADGVVPEAGARRCWPALAETLSYLVHGGLDDLYRGDVGRELGADLEEGSSPLTRADLRRAEVRWRPFLSLDLGRDGVDVMSDRSGITVAVALGLLAGLRDLKPDSFDHWHCLIESAKYAERMVLDALAWERDPAELLDADWLKLESRRIDRGRASESLPCTPPLLVEEAIWIGVVGRDGSAVSLVQSLGSAFGSGVVSGRTGLLLGNRGAGLALDPRLGSLLAPGRRPTAAPRLRSGPAGVARGAGHQPRRHGAERRRRGGATRGTPDARSLHGRKRRGATLRLRCSAGRAGNRRPGRGRLRLGAGVPAAGRGAPPRTGSERNAKRRGRVAAAECPRRGRVRHGRGRMLRGAVGHIRNPGRLAVAFPPRGGHANPSFDIPCLGS